MFFVNFLFPARFVDSFIYDSCGINQITLPEVTMNNTIKVLIVELEKDPRVEEISHTLESLQQIVGGYIQALYPFDDPVAIICNEEGKLLGLPWNRPLYDENGRIYDIIAGTFIIAGLTKDDFGSLSYEMIEKYTAMFETTLM